MTNYAADDVQRSLRRYVKAALGDAWTVRMQREVLADDKRPVAVVEFTAPVSLMAGAPPDRQSIPQGDVARMASFVAQCYPAIFDTARESKQEAVQVVQLLDDAITFGLVVDDPAVPGATLDVGRPGVVPVYDYAGVPVVGPDRGGPAEPYGFASVMDHSVQPIQDPIDEKRYTVALSLRLSWWRAGRADRAGPVTAAVPGAFVGEGTIGGP